MKTKYPKVKSMFNCNVLLAILDESHCQKSEKDRHLQQKLNTLNFYESSTCGGRTTFKK